MHIKLLRGHLVHCVEGAIMFTSFLILYLDLFILYLFLILRKDLILVTTKLNYWHLSFLSHSSNHNY